MADVATPRRCQQCQRRKADAPQLIPPLRFEGKYKFQIWLEPKNLFVFFFNINN